MDPAGDGVAGFGQRLVFVKPDFFFLEGASLRRSCSSDQPRVPYIRVVSKDLSGGIPRTETGGKVTVQGEGWARMPVIS